MSRLPFRTAVVVCWLSWITGMALWLPTTVPVLAATLPVPYLSQFTVSAYSNYCGTTSAAMTIAAYGLRPTGLDDAQFILDVQSRTGFTDPAKNTIDFIGTAVSSYGLSVSQVPIDGNIDNEFQSIRTAVAQGRPVIIWINALYVGRNYNGHFVVITGFSDDGLTVTVNDPDSASANGGTATWYVSDLRTAATTKILQDWGMPTPDVEALIVGDGLPNTNPVALLDPSFETGAPWQWFGPCNAVIYNNAPYDGANYLATNRNNTADCNSFYQDVQHTLQPSENYRFGIWMRSPTGQSLAGSVSLWALGDANQSVSTPFLISSQNWQCFETTLTVPSGTHNALRAQVYFLGPLATDYNFDYAMLQQDGGFLCPATERYRGEVVGSVSAQPTMTAGSTQVLQITLRNNGSATWDANTKLAPLPHDMASPFFDPNSWENAGRISSIGALAPGEVKTVPVTLRAPTTAGSYTVSFTLLQELVVWMSSPPESSLSFPITVTQATYSGTLVGTPTYQASMVAGTTQVVQVTIRNTGTASWDSNSRLSPLPGDQSSALADTSWQSLTRVMAAGPVVSGATKTFQFTIKAPSTPGTYKQSFGLVQEAVTWFADPALDAINLQITVTVPPPTVAPTAMPTPTQPAIVTLRSRVFLPMVRR